jgi:hypothetical protein
MNPIGKKHDQEAGTMKRKLWSVLGVVLMMVFTLMACSSSSDTPLSSAKAITAYSLAGATGVINEGAKTIAVTVPYGTVVTALKATFTTTGASVKIGSTVQVSGTTANDFTSGTKTYTVTAADASTQNYVVTVTVAPSNAKAITAYSLGGFAGTVNETAKTIAVTLPNGKDVTALVATFTTTGASVKIGTTVQVTGTTVNDFTSAVTYIVTAADATTQNYVVTITYAGGTWTAMTAFGGLARKEAVGFGFTTGKGYVGTGTNGTTYYSDFWEYNSTTGLWTQMADFGATTPTGAGLKRTAAVAFAIGTKGYVGTGYDGTTYYKDLWEYNPATNVWTEQDDLPGTGTVARKDAVGFTIGSKGYVGTGLNGTTYYADFYEFNPAAVVGNQWTAKANFGGLARASAVGLSIGAIGYIGTGYDGTAYYKDFWAYDPTANVWTKKSDFGGVARMSAVALSSVCGSGYIGLGKVPCGIPVPCSPDVNACPCGKDAFYFSDFWVYDPVNDKWTQVAYYDGGEITGKRAAAVGFSLGSASYFVGTGDDGSTSGSRYYKDFWKYVP